MKPFALLFVILLASCGSTDSVDENGSGTTATDPEVQTPPEPVTATVGINLETSGINWDREKKVKKANQQLKIGKSNINFTVNDATLNTSGEFTFSKGAWTTVDGVQAHCDLEIDLASAMAVQVDDDEKLALQSPNYLDIQQYPTATMMIAALDPDCTDCQVEAKLTLKDTTGKVSFPATAVWQNGRTTSLEGEFEIDGKAWNLINPDVDQEIDYDRLKLVVRVITDAE